MTTNPVHPDDEGLEAAWAALWTWTAVDGAGQAKAALFAAIIHERKRYAAEVLLRVSCGWVGIGLDDGESCIALADYETCDRCRELAALNGI